MSSRRWSRCCDRRRIVLRNDTAVRELEGLAQGIEWVLGEDPGEIELTEGKLRFGVLPASGQKTGWFFDQADNRLALARFGPRGGCWMSVATSAPGGCRPPPTARSR
jgi:23S rRNA G2069 N7-methylase RlmK/C1962 C5-methylase RlmI